MRRIVIGLAIFGAVALMLNYAVTAVQEQARLDRLAAERDARAEQNRINYLEWERQQRAIPSGRPMGKPLPGQRDA